jgi:hypothetical protein
VGAESHAAIPVASEGPSTELLHRGPPIFFYWVNLTVQQYDTNGQPGFLVKNEGNFTSGPFRIAVLAGGASHSEYSNGLAGGATQWYPTGFQVACCQTTAIIVDIDSQVPETKENDNSTSFNNSCQTYSCSSCNDGSCQCGGGLTACTDPSNPPTTPDLCGAHRGVNPQVGCVQEP